MSGLPIRNWDQLTDAIQSLTTVLQASNRLQYSHTYESRAETTNSSPKKIIDLPSDNDYKILIRNFSNGIVSLWNGLGGSSLIVGASALIIEPYGGIKIEIKDNYELWCASSISCEIAITVLSKKPKLGGNEEMPIPLSVALRLGAGLDNVGEHTPLSILESFGSDWYDIAYDTLISNQDLPVGYKLVKLLSYEPKATYEFNVGVDLNATIDWKTGALNPIHVYLFEFDQVSMFMNSAVAIMRGMDYDSLKNAVAQIMGQAKNSHTWVGKFPTTGGTFSISPGNLQNLIHISVATESIGVQGAVITEYDEATQTITIGGY